MTDFQKIFPDNRQDGETSLRKAQLVMLRILKIINYLCQKHQISYWLDGGTLLGAVRHQGFIPWDDDVDIVMPRTDYDRFLKVAERELPEDLFLLKHRLEKGYASHGIPPLKVMDKYSRVTSNETNRKISNQGLFVDIIPADKFGEGVFKGYRFKDYILKRSYRYLCGHYNNPMDYKRKKTTFFRKFTSLVFKGLPLSKMLGYAAGKLEHRTTRNNTLNKNYLMGYCLEVPWMRLWDLKEIFPLQEMKFEDASFPVAHQPDSVLKKFYGDYLALPPEDKRVTPHVEEVVIDIRKEG